MFSLLIGASPLLKIFSWSKDKAAENERVRFGFLCPGK
jgi:hypothetical protein